MRAEPVDAGGSEDPLGGVARQYAVEVEGDAEFPVGVVIDSLGREYMPRRQAVGHRFPNVGTAGRQEQGHVQSAYEAV